MTVQQYISQVMSVASSKFVDKTIVLFPKCDSNHWSLYVLFNVNGEYKYVERSILYLDSKLGEPNIYFINSLRD